MAAQDNASLTGTVKDSSGASVPNATVVVTNTEKGVTRQLTSNADGEYLAGGLPAGVYAIQVSAPGFKKYEARDITLRVAQKARVDVALEVGAVSNEVTVQGEGLAQVDTQSSELAGTVDSKELSKLQLNGRNFTQLVTLVPGVNNQTGQDEGQVGVNGNVEYSINGGRTEYNNWELDGGDNMDNGSNSTLNVYPSLDAIAEVRVLTGNYGAQYGRNASGTIEVETKSGTNQFHGLIYEYLRNNAFNARNYFLGPDQSNATRRTISATTSAAQSSKTSSTSSGHRNGAVTAFPDRCSTRLFPRTPSGQVISTIFVMRRQQTVLSTQLPVNPSQTTRSRQTRSIQTPAHSWQ